MPTLTQKINRFAERVDDGAAINIAIFGLGSVGHYLLEFLLALRDPRLRIHVVGRNRAKMECAVNLSRVAALIRGGLVNEIRVVEADFNSVDSLTLAFRQTQPDIVVNASRAYSGLKYGSISWQAVRAYGLWAPLAVRYLKNIMQAYAASESAALVINTSYADATNAWLKSAGLPHPDFGSGNLNHLVPRIKLAVAAHLGIEDPALIDEIDVTLATSHFHDVVISKEGGTEGVTPLLHVEHLGRPVSIEPAELYRRCAIAMPVDHRRNMMNASSNCEIISRLLVAVRTRSFQKLHVPGFDGLIGGYPVFVRPDGGKFSCDVFASPFSRTEMIAHNRSSIYLDGIADVSAGTLVYTRELVEKVARAFGCQLPREVPLAQSDEVAEWLIEHIILPTQARAAAATTRSL